MKSRRYFGGAYASTRTLNRGDRVAPRSKRAAAEHRSGIIKVVFAGRGGIGRHCVVSWDNGSEQLQLTADLRRA